MRFAATCGLLAALLCGPAGCRSKPTPKDITGDLERFGERACACKDEACAEKVIDDFVALVEANPTSLIDNDRARGAASRLGQCVIHAGMPLEKLKTQMQKLQKQDD